MRSRTNVCVFMAGWCEHQSAEREVEEERIGRGEERSALLFLMVFVCGGGERLLVQCALTG